MSEHEDGERSPVDDAPRCISATASIAAPPATIFAVLSDPGRHADIDGNDNVAVAVSGSAGTVGDVFVVRLTNGGLRENRVVEFEPDRRIAWMPGDVGVPSAGHLWRWELEPEGTGTRVVHTYDFSRLEDDPKRQARARSTTPAMLAASLDRLAAAVGA